MNEPDLTLQSSESGLEATSLESQNNYLIQALVLFQSTQNAISSSITELHSEISHIKSTLFNFETKEQSNINKFDRYFIKYFFKVR